MQGIGYCDEGGADNRDFKGRNEKTQEETIANQWIDIVCILRGERLTPLSWREASILQDSVDHLEQGLRRRRPAHLVAQHRLATTLPSHTIVLVVTQKEKAD